MKFVSLALLTLTAVASAQYIDIENIIDLEDITAYGYLSKVGRPSAERIRLAEEQEGNGSRIVAGSNSNIGQFPYQAGLLALYPGGQSFCIGSLVHPTHVLIAAHCWFDGQNQASRFTVVLGSKHLFSGGTRATSSNVVTHGSYNPALIRNDIAMIVLPSKVVISSNIALIALPSVDDENFSGIKAIASGFGFTSDGGNIANNQGLSNVTLLVITNSACRLAFPNIIQFSNICTREDGGRSTCQGVSGGPLIVTRNNTPLLIGIKSFESASGCKVGSPTVYSSVISFIAWINGQL